MLKKLFLGDSPITSIIGLLSAFFVVLQEHLTTGNVPLVYAIIAALIAVVGRLLPDGPLKDLLEIFTKSKPFTKESSTEEPAVTEPVVEEPVVEEPVVEEPVVEEPVVKVVEAPEAPSSRKAKRKTYR